MSSLGARKQKSNRFRLRASLSKSLSLGQFSSKSSAKESILNAQPDLAPLNSLSTRRRNSQPLNTNASTSFSFTSSTSTTLSTSTTTATQPAGLCSQLINTITTISTYVSTTSQNSFTSIESLPPPPRITATFIDAMGREHLRDVIYAGSSHCRKAGCYKIPIRRTQSLAPPGRHAGGGKVRPRDRKEIVGEAELLAWSKSIGDKVKRKPVPPALPPLGIKYSMKEDIKWEGVRRDEVVSRGVRGGREVKGGEEGVGVMGGEGRGEVEVGVAESSKGVKAKEKEGPIPADVPEEKGKALHKRHWSRHMSVKQTRGVGGEERREEVVVSEGAMSEGAGGKVEGGEGEETMAEGPVEKGKVGGKCRWSRLLAQFSH